MNITETSGYANSKKKIKKNHDAVRKLNDIINHIEAVQTFTDLKKHPMSYIYGYEELREDLTGYYRFSLDKNRIIGKLRLVFSCSNDSIVLEYISDEHYEDFKRYLIKEKR